MKPDAGAILLGPKRLDLVPLKPSQRRGLGFSRTYQYTKIFGSMTVIENAMVGFGPLPALRSLREVFDLRCRRATERALREKAENALGWFGDRLAPRSNDLGLSLSYANRRRLEFARALVGSPALMLLDEPTAGMNPYETLELQRIIFQLRGQGLTFLIIEHKLFFLEDLADRVMVLVQGKRIAEGSVQEIRSDPGVRAAYLGDHDAAQA
jgi:ABC-type branched-subunit amino acid transport system ATPase component